MIDMIRAGGITCRLGMIARKLCSIIMILVYHFRTDTFNLIVQFGFCFGHVHMDQHGSTENTAVQWSLCRKRLVTSTELFGNVLSVCMVGHRTS